MVRRAIQPRSGANVGQACANGCHNEGCAGVVFLKTTELRLNVSMRDKRGNGLSAGGHCHVFAEHTGQHAAQ
jgi:hypothetical protein